MIVYQDVTRLSQAVADVELLAFYDPLTSLPNRVLFRERLENALVFVRRGQERVRLGVDAGAHAHENGLDHPAPLGDRGEALDLDRAVDHDGPDPDLDRALQPFRQVVTVRRRSHDSIGLGLPIVRGLVEA